MAEFSFSHDKLDCCPVIFLFDATHGGVHITMSSKFEVDHNACRGRVCVVCYRKGDRKISPREAECIGSHLIEGYSVQNLNFPSALCTDCHIKLSKKINDNEYQLLPKVSDYDPQRPRFMRSTVSTVTSCMCKICTVAKMTGLEYTRSLKKKKGRTKTTTPVKYHKICGNCFHEIYQGSNQSAEKCRYSRRDKVRQVEEILESPTTLQRVTARVLKRQSDTPLATLGPNKKKVCESSIAKPQFESDQLLGIQTDLGLSNSQTRILAQDIRLVTGSRKSIQTGFSKEVTKNSHRLDEYFQQIKIRYEKVNKETKVTEEFEQVTIVCSDLPNLVDVILKERSLEDCKSLLVKIGLDGGGGFLKFCLGVFDIENLVCKTTGISKKFKGSGVKKIFLIKNILRIVY